MRRQTLSYEDLGHLMYRRKAAGVLAAVLGHVAFYCNDEKLPPLTAIVVGKYRGKPGRRIPIDLNHVDQERQRVFDHDWYNVYPPSEEELSAAYAGT